MRPINIRPFNDPAPPNEIDLRELEDICGTSYIMIVDIDENGKNLLNSKSIKVGDLVFAEVYSDVAYDRQTREWFISSIEKVAR